MSSYTDWWTNSQPGIVRKVHIPADQIIGAMSSSYVVLWPQETGGIVDAQGGDMFFVYRPGTVAFGGNPYLQVGYPNNVGALLSGVTLGVDGLTAKILKRTLLTNTAIDLSVAENQPLVVSFASANASYGPIASSTVADGGAGYLAGDTFVLQQDSEATGTILTVDGDGAVLTYSIDTPGASVPLGANAIYGGLHLSESSLADGGSGYAQHDTFELLNGDPRPIGVVDTVDGDGAVLTYHFTNSGAGVSVNTGNSTHTLTGGGSGLQINSDAVVGVGFTLNVVSVTQGNGTIDVYFVPSILTL